jgi:fatty-acyl-CoA synthase
LRQGEIGEIVVRGHSVKDYVDPVDMVAARRNGWHHTEDLGYVDDAGFLYVVGRTKDMIVSGGFKIAAADVERAIMQLPAIKECAVVGVPDTIRGESLMAVVTFMNSKAIDIQAIISHCRAVLGQNRTPRRIEQWDEIPKTSVGKIDKKAIRARFAKSIESRQNAS